MGRRIGTIVLLSFGLGLTGLGAVLSHGSSWRMTITWVAVTWIIIGGGILSSHKYG